MCSHGEWLQSETGGLGKVYDFFQKMKFKQRFQRHVEGQVCLDSTSNASTWEVETGESQV